MDKTHTILKFLEGKTTNKEIQLLKELLSRVNSSNGKNFYQPAFFRKQLVFVNGSNALPLGQSRLEYLPDLPLGMEWPQHDDKALDFVAQINLADLEAGFHPALPEKGWLYFFVGDYWGGRIIHHRVLYFDGPVTDLARTEPPSHLKPPARFNSQTALLTFRSGFSIDPKFLDKIEEGSFLFDPQYKAYAPLGEPLYELSPDITRVGGHPYAFQGGGQEHNALLYLNGFETMIKHGWFDPPPLFDSTEKKEKYWEQRHNEIVKAGDLERMQAEVERYNNIKDDLEEHIQPIEMLFGLESTLGRDWGDAGFLEFFIRQDDLAQHDFSRTFCEIIST
jgi:uncharacterized protein YwqG